VYPRHLHRTEKVTFCAERTGVLLADVLRNAILSCSAWRGARCSPTPEDGQAAGSGSRLTPVRSQVRVKWMGAVLVQVERQAQFPDQLLFQLPGPRVHEPGDEGVPSHPCRERGLAWPEGQPRQRYTLLARRAHLSLDGRQALQKLLAANQRLHTAYLLKESFDQGYRRAGWARRFFDAWTDSLQGQDRAPFEKFAAMVERNWDGIAAYCRAEAKVSLGFVEGLNTKIRVIQRLAYGLRDEEYLRLRVLTCMLPEI
jgi:Transposase